MHRNRLDRESSPYLLQHEDNPVHWQPWDRRALDRARRENRPILLSVGYAACRWYHVMAHESFEDPATAAQMNADFVNIKIDREERPDLDLIYISIYIYQSALAMMGRQGGWPLTMFLTPEGEPFWGGAYFPPEPRYGLPAFREVLTAVAETFRNEPGKVQANAAGLREGLAALARPRTGGGIAPKALDDAADGLLGMVDSRNGGLKGALKFPRVPIFDLLWRAWKRGGRNDCRDAVTKTLTAMCQGGIYDHLSGGFARYATDDAWHVPHFEKMLYDNALILGPMTEVWRETKTPLFETRIRETVGWMIRERTVEDGGFAGSLDADSEGEEGRFYTWSEGEIDRLLGKNAGVFKAAYGVTSRGNWEGRNILDRGLAPGDPRDEGKLAACRRILKKERDGRNPPARRAARSGPGRAPYSRFPAHAMKNPSRHVIDKQARSIKRF